MRRKVSLRELQCVEYNRITLIETFSVGRGEAVGHFTSEFDERILAQSKSVIRAVVVGSPEQNGLWCFRFFFQKQLPLDSFIVLFN